VVTNAAAHAGGATNSTSDGRTPNADAPAISLVEFRALTLWTQKFRDRQLEANFRHETFGAVRSFAVKTWALIWSSWIALGLLLMIGMWRLAFVPGPVAIAAYFGAGTVFFLWYFLQKSAHYEKIYENAPLAVVLSVLSLAIVLVDQLPKVIQVSVYPFYVLAIVVLYTTLDLGFVKVLVGGALGTSLIALAGVTQQSYPSVSGGPFLFLGMLAAANGLGVTVFRYTDQQRRLQFLTLRLLDAEKFKSDRILHSVFPAKIAAALRDGLTIDPVRVDDVTVLFTDLSGFTAWSSSANPRQIVDAVEAMFGVFDELAVEHKLDKIKTIGDAYMACSGLTVQHADQVRQSIEFARKAILAVESLRPVYFPDAPSIGLRVGIATGPVVAGVMGRIKPSFDVWGSTVNLASRLESSGKTGLISVCHRTVEVLPDLRQEGQLVDLTLKGVGIHSVLQLPVTKGLDKGLLV
jgi:class 3 adenylate cyclase